MVHIPVHENLNKLVEKRLKTFHLKNRGADLFNFDHYQ